jgi:adenylate cyclase
VRKERKKSEDLLLNILPIETAKELKRFGKAITKKHEEVTVMFFDVKEFSSLAEHIPPDSLILILDFYFSAFDDIISKYSDIEKIKTIGDCYMCVSGLHSTDKGHAMNAVSAACDIMEYVAKTQAEVLQKFQYSFNFRGGLHSGGLVSGVVGSHKYAYDVWGDTVNIASRMESSGEIGKINVSNATYELVKDHYICSYRGSIEVKNHLSFEMYFVNRS